MPIFWHRLWTGRYYYAAVCATATYCNEKQRFADCTASSSVRGEFVQAARLWRLLSRVSCWRSAALLQNLGIALCSCLVLPQILDLPGYRFLLCRCRAPLECLGCAFTHQNLGCDSSTVFSNVKSSTVVTCNGSELAIRSLYSLSACP